MNDRKGAWSWQPLGRTAVGKEPCGGKALGLMDHLAGKLKLPIPVQNLTSSSKQVSVSTVVFLFQISKQFMTSRVLGEFFFF